MVVTQNTPDLLVIRLTRWKAPLFWAAVTVVYLLLAAALVWVADVPTWMVIAWLCATAAWSGPMALYKVEKSMLVLNAAAGTATLHRRDMRGHHRQHWPLDEVQSTRVTRVYRHRGPATGDPKRDIALYVRDGMDEGHHPLSRHPVQTKDALMVSSIVSDWMKAWRNRA